VRIARGGGGTFEDNDLRGNYLATWDIDPASSSKVPHEQNTGQLLPDRKNLLHLHLPASMRGPNSREELRELPFEHVPTGSGS
jgi:hypothetical protein